MRKMMIVFALLTLLPAVANASEPTEADRIRNCRWFTKLSPAKQREAASQTPYSVEEHRGACRAILARNTKAPSRGRSARPAPAPRTPRENRSEECNCSFGSVCVRRGLGWSCEYHGSSLNRCQASFDCRGPGSRCEDGKCTW